MRRVELAALLVALALCAASCGGERQRVVVLASASLASAFAQLERLFEQEHPGVDVTIEAAGTPLLVQQLREGAPGDVFASADERQMARVVDAGQAAAPPAPFAGNALAIVTAPGATAIRTLADLADPSLAVALCGPRVPAGRYARDALARSGVHVASASDEPSVSAVLAKVRLGELDAGIVYASDAARAPDLRIVPIEERHNVKVTCWIAPLRTGAQPDLGAAFVAFVRTARAREVLAAEGFSPL